MWGGEYKGLYNQAMLNKSFRIEAVHMQLAEVSRLFASNKVSGRSFVINNEALLLYFHLPSLFELLSTDFRNTVTSNSTTV